MPAGYLHEERLSRFRSQVPMYRRARDPGGSPNIRDRTFDAHWQKQDRCQRYTPPLEIPPKRRSSRVERPSLRRIYSLASLQVFLRM